MHEGGRGLVGNVGITDPMPPHLPWGFKKGEGEAGFIIASPRSCLHFALVLVLAAVNLPPRARSTRRVPPRFLYFTAGNRRDDRATCRLVGEIDHER